MPAKRLLHLLLLAIPVAVPHPAMAQVSEQIGPPVSFQQVTGVPTPLQSISGRFSSLSPTKRRACSNREAVGRVVNPKLIIVDERFCGRRQTGVLVNVQFSNIADADRMVTGSKVTIRAVFQTADEERDGVFYANFLIAEKARLMDVDASAAPAQAFVSYMLCQPPELDELAAKLRSELCVQNTIVSDIREVLPALETAARSPMMDANADGGGNDPNAITCRRDTEKSDIHLSSTACARGSYWNWWSTTKAREDRYWSPAPP